MLINLDEVGCVWETSSLIMWCFYIGIRFELLIQLFFIHSTFIKLSTKKSKTNLVPLSKNHKPTKGLIHLANSLDTNPNSIKLSFHFDIPKT